MGRPSVVFHVLTLLMTALLAWPWNVILSSAESSQVASQHWLVPVPAFESMRGHRLLRSGWWDRQSCSVIAPDYDRDEGEGDDGGPLSLSSALSPVQVLAAIDCPRPLIESQVFRARIPLREHRCPLRC